MSEAPASIWINWGASDMVDPPIAVGACVRPDLVGRLHSPAAYISEGAHLAALQAARIEGYEIARKEAAAMGCHLLRPDLVPALTQKDAET